jgi:short-subunit dehydrogenase
MRYFKDKVIWITGATSGIGEALSRELSSQGARLILSGRNVGKLQALREELKTPVDILPFDLSDAKSLPGVARQAISSFGHLDILINNGGISQRSLAMETPVEIDRKLMEVNYFGNIALTKQVLPHFLHRNQGQVVVVSSLVGKFSTPYRSGYSASKHALHGFYDGLRAEVSVKGINITIICPGFIRTDISVNALNAQGAKAGEMDERTAKGMKPSVCARKICVAVARKKREAYIGQGEIMGIYLKRFFPGIFAWYVRKAAVR